MSQLECQSETTQSRLSLDTTESLCLRVKRANGCLDDICLPAELPQERRSGLHLGAIGSMTNRKSQDCLD